jgi:AraC family transcriptional regulator
MLRHRLDLSITDISYELGFSDSAVFSRSFKKFFDLSPKEIRNSNNCKENSLTFHYNEPVDEN